MAKKEKPKTADPERVENTEFNGQTMNIILDIPDSTFHLDVVAKMIDDDENTKIVTARLGLADIRRMRQDFLENVEGGDDYNTVYTASDQLRKAMENK